MTGKQRGKTPPALDRWLADTRRLLALEQRDEADAAREQLRALSDAENPAVLGNLRLAQLSTALFGRALLRLALPSPPKPHRLTVGDLVQLRTKKNSGQGDAALPSGIVARIEDKFISVALGADTDVDEDELLAQGSGLTLDQLPNQATFLKISSALDQLAKFDYGQAQNVVEVYVEELYGARGSQRLTWTVEQGVLGEGAQLDDAAIGNHALHYGPERVAAGGHQIRAGLQRPGADPRTSRNRKDHDRRRVYHAGSCAVPNEGAGLRAVQYRRRQRP